MKIYHYVLYVEFGMRSYNPMLLCTQLQGNMAHLTATRSNTSNNTNTDIARSS